MNSLSKFEKDFVSTAKILLKEGCTGDLLLQAMAYLPLPSAEWSFAWILLIFISFLPVFFFCSPALIILLQYAPISFTFFVHPMIILYEYFQELRSRKCPKAIQTITQGPYVVTALYTRIFCNRKLAYNFLWAYWEVLHSYLVLVGCGHHFNDFDPCIADTLLIAKGGLQSLCSQQTTVTVRTDRLSEEPGKRWRHHVRPAPICTTHIDIRY